MQKNKLEVIKIDNIMGCWTCEGKGKIKNIVCPTCEGTGTYNEASYIHIVNGMAFGGDTIK